MVKSFVSIGIVALLAVLICASSASAQQGPATGTGTQVAPPAAPALTGPGAEAMKAAAAAHKYLFIFFYRTDDHQMRSLREVFEGAMRKVADRADSLVIRVDDPAEQSLVTHLKADRAPMPLAMAIAPNGAITGGFPLKFEEKQLMSAFCSESTERVLKALQDKKLVLLCVQNNSSKFAAEALRAAEGVKADPKYGAMTEIVMMDPADPKEADSVKRLSLDAQGTEAVTILLAPPGSIISRLVGATKTDALLAEVQKAAAPKAACCPGGKCGPRPPAPATPPPNKPAGQN